MKQKLNLILKPTDIQSNEDTFAEISNMGDLMRRCREIQNRRCQGLPLHCDTLQGQDGNWSPGSHYT